MHIIILVENIKLYGNAQGLTINIIVGVLR